MRHKVSDSSVFRFLVCVALPLGVILWAVMHPNNYYSSMVNTLGINILLAASLNMVNGFSGMFSMGHAAFMAVGAYVSAYLTLSPDQKLASLPGLPEWLVNLNVPFPAALILAGLAAVLLALIIGFPVLRVKGHYLSVVTLGMIVIVRSILDNNDEYTNGARGLTGLPPHATTAVIFITLAISLYIMYRLLRSAYGRGLIAMRDDSVAAQTMGINLTKKKLSIFCISAFFAGIGGALWGHNQSVISGQFFYFNMSFQIVQTSIIGGMASLSGAIIGAIFMTFIPQLLLPLESGVVLFGQRLPDMYGISNIIMALFLIILIIFRRQGIMGSNELIVESMFSKKTYTGIFRKEEYEKLGKGIRDGISNLFRRGKKEKYPKE